MRMPLLLFAVLSFAVPAFGGAEIFLAADQTVSAGQTISRLNFEERVLTDSESTVNWSVTIPSGTTAIVATVHAYGFHTSTPLASVALGAQNFTIDATLDPNNDAGIGMAHLFSPASTGAQTITFTIGPHGYAGYMYVIYYSGTATDGLRDSDNDDAASLTLTTEPGDYVVSAATDADNSSITWTNASEIDEYTVSGYAMAIAETVADGTTETVSVQGTNVGRASIVLKPGS